MRRNSYKMTSLLRRISNQCSYVGVRITSSNLNLKFKFAPYGSRGSQYVNNVLLLHVRSYRFLIESPAKTFGGKVQCGAIFPPPPSIRSDDAVH